MIWKVLRTKPEFQRLVTRVQKFWERDEIVPSSRNEAESRALGYLAQLWLLADSHIREDDTLDMSADEVDQLLGTAGLAQVLGPNWLEILDSADQVKLPNWLSHNGAEARARARGNARVEKHRAKLATAQPSGVTDNLSTVSSSNGTPLHSDTAGVSSLPIPSHPIPTQPLKSRARERHGAAALGGPQSSADLLKRR